MIENYCTVCGNKLILREHPHEGIKPFCTQCNCYRYPKYNVAVSLIVINESNGKLLLIKQYGKDFYKFVAGYVDLGESAEEAAFRELNEETGMHASRVEINRTKYFPKTNTLMINFTAFVPDDSEMDPNYEVDSYAWFTKDEALENIVEAKLACEFLKAYYHI